MTSAFDAQHIVGLSEACVVQRIRDEGYNELPSSGQRTVLAIAFDVVREPNAALWWVVGAGSITLTLVLTATRAR